MMSSEGFLSSLYELGQHNAAIAGVGIIILLLLSSRVFRRNANVPPYLPETIPFLSNTLQFSMEPAAFWARAL